MRQIFRMALIAGIAFALAGCGPAETPATAPPFDNSKSGAVPPPVKGAKPKAGFE